MRAVLVILLMHVYVIDIHASHALLVHSCHFALTFALHAIVVVIFVGGIGMPRNCLFLVIDLIGEEAIRDGSMCAIFSMTELGIVLWFKFKPKFAIAALFVFLARFGVRS